MESRDRGGFGWLDKRVEYSVRGEARQNFGDYLPELFMKELLTYPRVDADVFRLVGSVVSPSYIRRSVLRSNGAQRGTIAFWGCGARDAKPIPKQLLACCQFFGVRGELTRDLVGLPADTVLGDPGLLAPLFHSPRPVSEIAGKTVCMPHIHDVAPKEVLLKRSGADVLIHPEIPATEEALRGLLDQIAAAKFVLTGSLHGAIIACAYGRPFAFWDTGHVDIPFKWHDFASSLGAEIRFVKNLAEGQQEFSRVAEQISIPSRTDLLCVAPFVPRPSAVLKAMLLDGDDQERADARLLEVLEAAPGCSLLERDRLGPLSDATRQYRERVSTRARQRTFQTLRRVKQALVGG